MKFIATDVDDSPAKLAAHAWLQCGDAIVNGATSEEYAVVSTFSWAGRHD